MMRKTGISKNKQFKLAYRLSKREKYKSKENRKRRTKNYDYDYDYV